MLALFLTFYSYSFSFLEFNFVYCFLLIGLLGLLYSFFHVRKA